MPASRMLTAASLAALLAACTPSLRDAPSVIEAEPMVEEEIGLAEPVMEPVFDAAPIVTEAPSSSSYAGRARRGVVTAGDIDDALNLNAFSRYLSRAGRETGLPKLGLSQPVLAQLVGVDGQPAPGARYTLRRPGAAEPFHSGYAGPDGRIAVFLGVLGTTALKSVEMRVFDGNGQETTARTLRTGQWQRVDLPFDADWQPDFLDLVLVVDTTGSMGDEIAFLNKELIGITRAAARTAPGLSVRYGLIAYRDHYDDYVVRNYGFTSKPSEMSGWLRGLRADGGGDYPEAAAAALKSGVGLNWRRGKGERILIHVADAPPHNKDAATYLGAAKRAAEKGVQVFTLGASGVADEAEYLMRQASVATGGRYMFLTDDSGVGNAHAEPTVSCYRVTRLAGLLTRILSTELTGRRHEAAAGDVIREVGTYRAGICRN
ncbi:MAG: vWA domain-containing protein [Albidovulum sp.]|uniref:vWA domain-containing protein n=1 Tax=Albidovulum sp. TaxID=1872424 RepID=UPI003C8DACEB